MNALRILFSIVALSIAAVTHGQVALGMQKLLYSDNQLPSSDPLDANFYIDASFATLRKNNDTINLFFSNWMGVSKYNGTLEKPFSARDWSRRVRDCSSNGLFIIYPDCYSIGGVEQGRINFYMPNIYKIDSNRLLAFTHIEDARDNCPNKNLPCPANLFYDVNVHYGIGIAYSSDGGSRWQICNRGNSNSINNISIVVPEVNSGTGSNIGGVPYVTKDGYFYVYFNECNGGGIFPSVARAPIDSVLSNAENGLLTNWKKFNTANRLVNNGFNQDGLTGRGSNIIPSFPGHTSPNPNYYDFHSDAAYSTLTGKFYITVNCVNVARTPGQDALLLYSSKNGVDWAAERVVDATVGTSHVYPTILGDKGSNDDFSQVGGKFYMLFPLKDPADFSHDDLFLRQVTDPAIVQIGFRSLLLQ